MTRISVITPWFGPNSPALLPDYRAAVKGAQVIAVDNGGPDAARDAIRLAAIEDEWIYLDPGINLGFAGGNNAGYLHATGDVIIFLNSDVAAPPALLAAVAADVRDGALYGPSVGHQLVAGKWLPYVEGWCVAATRATWARLGTRMDGLASVDPWDADAYPGPYWEDNDLSLRAAREGIALVQTQWPIHHKGGQSAGPLTRWAESFERNRATFAARAMAALADQTRPADTPALRRFYAECGRESDIQHHLPLLRATARGNVVELGTRGGVSTAALLSGVELRGGRVLSIDIDDCSAVAAGHPLWTFLQASSVDERAAHAADDAGHTPIDCLLIDTLHTVDQAAAELRLWEPRVAAGGTILMHDPVTFPGVWRAIRDYTAGRDDLTVTLVTPNNGMAIIEKGRP